MKTFDIQSIEIEVAAEKAHRYIADPCNLPFWAHAFEKADATSALLRTPNGAVKIVLHTRGDELTGIVDWTMVFPDGAQAGAFSRVVPVGVERCVYSFVLLAPPVPLEVLEGALNAQIEILAGELKAVKRIIEGL
jgi:hypothetical protein